MTNVDECERTPELAERVNAAAPARLADACSGIGARCIHISTDYVFAGRTEGQVDEDAAPEPLSCYGRSKRAGELGVLAAGANHAVVRVAWVFGPDRECFVDKALQTALRGQQVEAVADKFSSPTYTLDAADTLRALFPPDAPGGVYHLSQRGICSWREWAQEAIEAAIELGLPVAHPQVKGIRLADLRLMTARRPVHTALSCAKLEALAGRPMRPWREAVRDYVRLLRDAGRLTAG
jgi:dTDP-4-dehydrorhamnose reductase